ncbi:Mbeg1-like protein [Evansella cellulosilytica]|uniref:DUF2974 domain-containing protein n=1 Tax=Evansella cellulosilytica (strain ATCC 21833 / DSM 2522 / FERM P-1141 / JCM 9156 / N-4) TaxID=649639 RepID=E6TRG6_EVAC2|nr:Mbeg1-like protein [Evansella cellulosilytica]ADU31796.1 hypothetical protein Bcell_3555 [Evansella cellulosilytica DSM 2522]
MSLKELSEQEKYLLLELSYWDIPPLDFDINNDNFSITITEFFERAKEYERNEHRFHEIELIESILVDSPSLQRIELTAYQNNNPNDGNNSSGKSESGFVGYAFADDQGNIATAFRGSEDISDWDHLRTDWYSNVEAGLGREIQQQLEANAFFEKYTDNIGGEKILLGHSKGGNLASYVFANHYEDNNLHAYIVNGQPIHWRSLTPAQQEKFKGDNYEYIVHTGDIVSALGYAPYVTKTVTTNKPFLEYASEDIAYAHSLWSVDFNENGEFKEWHEGASLQRNIGNPIVATLMTRAERIEPLLTAAEISVAFANRVVDEITTYFYIFKTASLIIIENAVKGLVDKAKRAANTVVDGLTKLGNFSRKLINETKSAFDNLITSAKNLFSSTVNKIKGSGVAIEPYIKVQLARTSYYKSRLQSVKRRTNDLQNMVRILNNQISLMDNSFQIRTVSWQATNLLSNSERRINSNITYLNDMARLLEQNEAQLLSEAKSLSF